MYLIWKVGKKWKKCNDGQTAKRFKEISWQGKVPKLNNEHLPKSKSQNKNKIKFLKIIIIFFSVNSKNITNKQ